jgi:hypothetical protein
MKITYDVDKKSGLWLKAGGLTIKEQRQTLAEHFDYLSRDARQRMIPQMSGGSFTTGTVQELIYANTASGTAKNTFTAEATAILNDVAGMGAQAQLDPYFFKPVTGVGKAIKIIARGIASTTVTPTYQFLLRMGATGTGGTLVWEMPAATTLSGIASKGWEVASDIIVRTTGGAGANSTVQGIGLFTGDSTGWNANSLGLMGWSNNTQPGTIATFDISITNTINLNAVCSASSASNSLQCLQLLVWGMN